MTGWQRSKQPYTWKRNGKRVQGLGHKINDFRRHREDLLSRAPRADYQVGQNAIITNPSSLALSEQFPNMPPAYPGYSRASEGSCIFRRLCAVQLWLANNLGWTNLSCQWEYTPATVCAPVRASECRKDLAQSFLLHLSRCLQRKGMWCRQQAVVWILSPTLVLDTVLLLDRPRDTYAYTFPHFQPLSLYLQ